MQYRYLFIVLVLVFTSCASHYTNTLVSCDYDKEKNQTNYMVLPYGTVDIPGEWYKTHYNSSSRQQFFRNSDSILIAISFGSCNKYEFNSNNSKKGFEFVKAYYEWEANYFINTYHLEQELLETNEKENFIIWRVFGKNENSNIDTFFLFGEKNCRVSNLSIMATDKWQKDEKINFLKRTYLEK